MKYYWKVYKTNKTFDIMLNEIEGCPFKKDKTESYDIYDYIWVTYGNDSWGMESPREPDRFIRENYEFKGEIGLKWIREQKLKKLD